MINSFLKKQLIFLTSIGLLSSVIVYQGFASFSDVQSSHKFYSDISYVHGNSIVSGYADGTYKPEALINRAEFTKIIIGSIYTSDQITSCYISNFGFSDVDRDAWFAPYVCIAKKEGIINGYADGTFKPTKTISIPEAMKIIFVANKIDIDPYIPENDFGEEPQWYEQWINAFLWNFVSQDENLNYDDPSFLNINNQAQYGDVAQMNVNRGEMAYFISQFHYERFFETYIDTDIGVSLSLPTQFKGKTVDSIESMSNLGERIKTFEPFKVQIFSKELMTQKEIETYLLAKYSQQWDRRNIGTLILDHRKQINYKTQEVYAQECLDETKYYADPNRELLNYISIPDESPLYDSCELDSVVYFAGDLGRIVGMQMIDPGARSLFYKGVDKTGDMYVSMEVLTPKEIGIGTLSQDDFDETVIEEIRKNTEDGEDFLHHSELSVEELEIIAENGTIIQYLIEEGELLRLFSGQNLSSINQGFLDNTDLHNKIWNDFNTLIPDAPEKSKIKHLQLFAAPKEYEDVLAFVSQTSLEDDEWMLAINLSQNIETNGEYKDAEMFYSTLIHEYAHIIFLGNESRELETIECTTIELDTLCLLEDSPLAQFTKQFWEGSSQWKNFLEDDDFETPESAAYRYFNTPDEYVSPYSASKPTEDIAESFRYFITVDPKPIVRITSPTKVQKILWMYGKKDLVELRTQIRKGLAELQGLE